METKRKNRFWKGLLIYILVMLAVIAVGLAVFWQYMAAYEAARPEGTMDAWIETRSDDALSGGIARWAEEHASARQSARGPRPTWNRLCRATPRPSAPPTSPSPPTPWRSLARCRAI